MKKSRLEMQETGRTKFLVTVLRTFVLFGTLCMPSALAATAWNGGGGSDHSWFNTANWNNGLPDASQSITINGASYTAVVDTADAVSSNFTLTAGALIMDSGRLWTIQPGELSVGSGFTLTVNGGSVTGALSNGNSMSMNGTLNIKGNGEWVKFIYYNYIYGTINLGDAASSGSWNPVARITRADASSTFRGWGLIRIGGWADNYLNGKMIADGWGGSVDRELLFQQNGLADQEDWRANGNTTDKGWYAVNRAKLTLPVLSYSASVKSRGWGSNGGSEAMAPTMVNSFWLTFDTISATKKITASLYAKDHSEVPTYNTTPSGLIAGIWKFEPETGFAFSGAVTNVFRYDHVAAAGREAALSLWHYERTRWIDMATKPNFTVMVNTNAGVKRVTVTGYSSTNDLAGFFAIGVNVEIPRKGALLQVQ